MTNGTRKERLIIRLCYTYTIKRTSHKFSKQEHIFGPESNVEYQIDTAITNFVEIYTMKISVMFGFSQSSRCWEQV
jgi:hypothetical protein